MNSLAKAILFVLSSIVLTSCGSFGQGMLMGLCNLGSSYSTGYGWGNNYSPSYSSESSSTSSSSSLSATRPSSSSASVSSQFDWSTAPTYVAPSASTYSGTSSGSSSTPSSTSSGYQKTCHLCHGLKKCSTCNGNRSYINPLTNKYVSCPNCSNGLCSHCHGTGLN